MLLRCAWGMGAPRHAGPPNVGSRGQFSSEHIAVRFPAHCWFFDDVIVGMFEDIFEDVIVGIFDDIMVGIF